MSKLPLLHIASRWRLGVLMCCGIIINYIDRVNISHALIPLSKELHLNHIQQGIVLSAFSWGYVTFMFVGGILVDRWGAVRISAGSATIWSLATAWTGVSQGFQSIFASRLIVGAGEAPIFPANARIVHDEFPIDERGKATALFDAGSYIGIAITAPIIVYLMTTYGWRISFLACSCFGLLWAIIWKQCAVHLQSSRTSTIGAPISTAVWTTGVNRLLKSRKIWGASFGFFCYNYTKSFYLTWFPSYLVTERGFSFLKVGVIGMLPPLCAVAGEFIAGAWTDKMIRDGISVTVARKLPICLGMLLGGIIVFTGAVTSSVAAIAILSFAFAATIAASPGIWAIPGDLAPSSNYVGTIGGIQNTFSNLAGIMAPFVTGIVVAKTGSFSIALTISAALAVSGALSYWFIVGELQPLWHEREET